MDSEKTHLLQDRATPGSPWMRASAGQVPASTDFEAGAKGKDALYEPIHLSMQAPTPTRTVAWQVGSAGLYAATSISMNFVNKYTMQVFPLTNVVVSLQMACTWLILSFLQTTGHTNYPAFNWQKAKQLSGITILYTGNTVFSLVGLKTLNIPMYNVLKRLTPVMILVLKSLIRKQWPARDITGSVLLLVLGCIIAGIGDLTFDLLGYVFALLSCASQALYLLIVEFQGDDYHVSSTEMLYYNSVTSLPILLGIVFVSGEAAALPGAYHKGIQASGTFWLWFNLLSCALMGMLLNYAQFLCTTVNSALTTTIVGVAKGLLAVLLGFFFLGGVPFHPVNVAGICLNTLGVCWYTYIKYKSRHSGSSAVAATKHRG